MLMCNNCLDSLDSQTKHSNNPVTQCSRACTKLTPNDNCFQAKKKKKKEGKKEKKLTSPERCCPVAPKHAITHSPCHSNLSTVKKLSHHPNIKKKGKKEQQTEGRLPVLFFYSVPLVPVSGILLCHYKVTMADYTRCFRS